MRHYKYSTTIAIEIFLNYQQYKVSVNHIFPFVSFLKLIIVNHKSIQGPISENVLEFYVCVLCMAPLLRRILDPSLALFLESNTVAFEVTSGKVLCTENVHIFSESSFNLAFVGICLVIISEWPPLAHRLLWIWWIESQGTGQLIRKKA